MRFTLTADWLVGTWLGGPVSPIVTTPFGQWERAVPQAPMPTSAPSIYRGRFLGPTPAGLPADTWRALSSVTRTGSQIDLDFSGATGNLTGTLDRQSQSVSGTVVDGNHAGDAWSATRAPDEVA